MKGVYFAGDREIELLDFPDPEPGPREVIVQMKASGMCGSDLHPYRAPKSERSKRYHYSGCEKCKMCKIGYYQMCLNDHVVYGGSGDGGHAPFMRVKPYM